MNPPVGKLLVPAAGVCLLGVLLYALLPRNPYRRLDYYSSQLLRLATSTNRYTLSDHLTAVVRRVEPYQYYGERAQREQKVLLASGLLIETNVTLPNTWSERDLVAALRKTSGLYWAVARVDTTNHLARLICKPHQADPLRQVLRNQY
jgi:hypothetical protein